MDFRRITTVQSKSPRKPSATKNHRVHRVSNWCGFRNDQAAATRGALDPQILELDLQLLVLRYLDKVPLGGGVEALDKPALVVVLLRGGTLEADHERAGAGGQHDVPRGDPHGRARRQLHRVPVLRAVEADDLTSLVVDLRLRGNARDAHPADLAADIRAFQADRVAVRQLQGVAPAAGVVALHAPGLAVVLRRFLQAVHSDVGPRRHFVKAWGSACWAALAHAAGHAAHAAEHAAHRAHATHAFAHAGHAAHAHAGAAEDELHAARPAPALAAFAAHHTWEAVVTVHVEEHGEGVRAAAFAAKEGFEDVVRLVEREPSRAAAAAHVRALLAEAVVVRALVRIVEHIVGLGDALEGLLGLLLVVLVLVRVPLERELLVRFGNLRGRRLFPDQRELAKVSVDMTLAE